MIYVKTHRSRIIDKSETDTPGFVPCANDPGELFDLNGVPVWALRDGQAIRRSQEDIQNDTPGDWLAPVPSDMDLIEAQVMYTALMTDTLLEE